MAFLIKTELNVKLKHDTQQTNIKTEIVSGISLPWKGNHYKSMQKKNDFFLSSIRKVIIVVKT